MNVRTSRSIALAGAIALTAMGSLPTLAQPGGDGDHLTLRLLVVQYPGPGGAEAAEDLVRLTAEVSDGAITIIPTFEGQDVPSAVMDGTTDLAMLPARDWHVAGVTSLDALDTPFLIDNDALAIAIAGSDIADQAMAGLEAVGVSGLVMWPEDLRHLIAFKPSGKVFRTPDDVAGATIFVHGWPGARLIEELGGSVWNEGVVSGDFTGDRHHDASSGALAGMTGGLWGLGVPINDQTVVAGDVPLFPKFQVLVANSVSLASMTDDQRRLLDDAVSRVRTAAIERHLSEVELGARRCAEGGTVITAGEEAVALFREAARPLHEAMAANPVTGDIIADIELLKAATPASPTAAACEPEPTGSVDVAVSDTTGYQGTLPPAGTFRADVTEEDLLARGASASFAERNSAIVTWTFHDDGTYVFEGVGGACPGTLESPDGTSFVATEEPGHPCGLGGAFLWREEHAGISMVLPSLDGLTPQDVADLKAFFERTWTTIG